jgi:acetolactate synthase regulatory subunit
MVLAVVVAMVVKEGLDVTMVVVLRVVSHMGMQICLVNLVVEVEMKARLSQLQVVVS